MMSIIIITLLMNLLIETSESFSVVVPGDQIVAHVGSTVTLPCWISPPENAEALEIRWYRHDQFSNPVLFYQHGKIQDLQEESFRNRSSLTLRSDQSRGLKDGDVSLRLENLRIQDEGSFYCYVSGDSAYDSSKVVLKVTDPTESHLSDPWKAPFFAVLVFALGLVGLILYKYRHKLTGKKTAKKVVEDTNIEELRKHAVQITIDPKRSNTALTISEDCKLLRDRAGYIPTGEGFPYQLCASGSQTFTSGRHYWEVELAAPPNPPKEHWIIGVMKHKNCWPKVSSALTPSDGSALTPSNGFWFLCSDGPKGFHTNTDPPVKLPLTPRPERLGVLLDYDDGQLSFYNVKERKHLLTMSSRFTGPVAPLFNPGGGDQSPITIIDCPKPVESPVQSNQPLLTPD